MHLVAPATHIPTNVRHADIDDARNLVDRREMKCDIALGLV